MFTTIDESISVVGVFAAGEFKPHRFRWREQIYQIEEVTLLSKVRDGGVPQWHFSVVVKGNLYRLIFWPLQAQWRLAEVWCA